MSKEMFFGLEARNPHLYDVRLSRCGCLRQCGWSFIVGVSHLSLNPIHMNLGFSRLGQVLDLGYSLVLMHKNANLL